MQNGLPLRAGFRTLNGSEWTGSCRIGGKRLEPMYTTLDDSNRMVNQFGFGQR